MRRHQRADAGDSPTSVSVGTSGYSGNRCSATTASSLSLPALIIAAELAALTNATCASPTTRSLVHAGRAGLVRDVDHLDAGPLAKTSVS